MANVGKDQQKARRVPLQVLSLGMPRTGTTSMVAALDILGCGPSYHGSSIYPNLNHCPIWSRALEAKYHKSSPAFTKADWDDFLGDYGTVSDIPVICFSEDLIAAYPDAKIILVERDIDSWFRSFNSAVIETFTMPINWYLVAADPQLMAPFYKMWHYIFLDPRGFFRASVKKELEKNARVVYREHYAHIRRIAPKERLLEYRLGSGWEPLCKFLGKELPNVPFPRLNEGDAVKERAWEFQVASLLNVLRNVAVVGGALAVGVVGVSWAVKG